jgi:hypothetical protein
MIEEKKINPDNFFLMRYIAVQREIHPMIKMLVNGKQVDIDNFLSQDMDKRKQYNITFEI